MISVYKPNSRLTGSAGSFRYSPEQDCVFAQLIKQSTWNDTEKVGGFKESMADPTKKTTVALNFTELGAILDCIERNRPFKTYHDAKEAKSISFTPWMSNDATPVVKGYSFGITVKGKEGGEDNPFYLGFTFAEARYLREFLIWALHQHFNRDRLQAQARIIGEVATPLKAVLVSDAPLAGTGQGTQITGSPNLPISDLNQAVDPLADF